MKAPFGIALAALLAAGSCGGGRNEQPDVILITIDTLRADRVGAYGDREAATPVLDSLADNGVRFARASAVAPITLPSHATLMTGRYPSAHGVRNNGTFVLADEEVTLAETFRDNGYQTIAAVAAFVLSYRFGLGQGFAVYDDDFGTDEDERRADAVTDAALDHVSRADPETPLFLWVHYFDPHASYLPPPPFAARSDPYRGEIAFVDREIGRLLEGLGRTRQPREMLVAVVADHGEAFGEHGETQHGLFVYEPTIRVPLVLSWPGHLPAGAVVEQVVSQVDLAPTLWSLTGIPAPDGAQGIDLAPLAGDPGTTPDRDGILVESLLPRLEFGWSELYAFREDDWKLIRAPRPELYDLASDPDERVNVVADDRRRAEEAQVSIDTLLTEGAALAAGDAAAVADPDTVASLRNLGYVAGGAVDVAAGDGEPLPDPKDRTAEYSTVKVISARLAAGEYATAIEVARRHLEDDADNTRVRHMLAEALLHSGDVEAGEREYRRLLAASPNDCIAMWRLGEIELLARRDDEAAAERYRASLECDPRQPDLWSRLAVIAEQRGQGREAARCLARALEIEPFRTGYRERLARRLFELGDIADSESQWRRILEQDPDHVDAHANLGALLFREGRFEEGVEHTRRALAVDGSLDRARFNLGVALVRLGRLDEAFDELDRYSAAVPGEDRGWVLLAKNLERRGRDEEARRAWQRALQARPDNEEARRALGR